MNEMETLLIGGECPFNYQCKHPDCMECMNIHMGEGGGEDE